MSCHDQQLHGYRHGHQLLSGTIRLPKVDQDLVDRLSDIAGPLGPGEEFSPYLTCYPLPSGTHYVIARTWQDHNAPRAGCVRTRSLLVSMAEWSRLDDIAALVELVTSAGPDRPAEKKVPSEANFTSLAPIDVLQVTELIEALFLEDRVPIVVFDAECPETIALRLLTAFWPAFRRNFSVSTFCRSPRTISRRSFDLVFAPKEARSRFSDWQGRRIDGRRYESARHAWSKTIVDHVFLSPRPSLRSLDVLGEMSGDSDGNEAALRISLLWVELQEKLKTSPTAALGMLDIVNTRSTRNVGLIRELEPAIADAAERASTSMKPSDAWRFFVALADKLSDLRLTLSTAKSIRETAVNLTVAHPSEAIEILPSFLGDERRVLMTSSVGEGLARVLDTRIADRLRNLDAPDLLGILFASPKLAKRALSDYPGIASALAEVLDQADIDNRIEARHHLLRFLVTDQHADLARILFADLDSAGLISEAYHLFETNRLGSESMRMAIVEHARKVNAVEEVREAVAAFGDGAGVDAILASMLRTTVADLAWVLTTHHLSLEQRLKLVRRLVRQASADDFSTMFEHGRNVTATVGLLTAGADKYPDLLSKIAVHAPMEPAVLVDLTLRILPELKRSATIEPAERALDAALCSDVGSRESDAIDILLHHLGSDLDGTRALRIGLDYDVSPSIASRNLIALNRAPTDARRRVLLSIEEMGIAIVGRYRLDLSLEAVEAAASLLWDSNAVSHGASLMASSKLLPFLLHARHDPASPLIAAAFPLIYKELQRNSVRDFLSLIITFVEWDKCKVARRRLVNAFLNSDWRATDIALAAARAGDAERILSRISREARGEKAISTIENEIELIPPPWQQQVRSAVLDIGNREMRLTRL